MSSSRTSAVAGLLGAAAADGPGLGHGRDPRCPRAACVAFPRRGFPANRL